MLPKDAADSGAGAREDAQRSGIRVARPTQPGGGHAQPGGGGQRPVGDDLVRRSVRRGGDHAAAAAPAVPAAGMGLANGARTSAFALVCERTWEGRRAAAARALGEGRSVSAAWEEGRGFAENGAPSTGLAPRGAPHGADTAGDLTAACVSLLCRAAGLASGSTSRRRVRFPASFLTPVLVSARSRRRHQR